jgi:hypothetical protein
MQVGFHASRRFVETVRVFYSRTPTSAAATREFNHNTTAVTTTTANDVTTTSAPATPQGVATTALLRLALRGVHLTARQ